MWCRGSNSLAPLGGRLPSAAPEDLARKLGWHSGRSYMAAELGYQCDGRSAPGTARSVANAIFSLASSAVSACLRQAAPVPFGVHRNATISGMTMSEPIALGRPHLEDSAAVVYKWVVGPFDNNVFVIRCKETGEAVLIDAANEHDFLREVAQVTGVRRVLTTHGHWDHIQAIAAFRDDGIDIAIGEQDSSMLPAYDLIIQDGEVTEVGRLRLSHLHTPGHTPGSMSFVLEGTPWLFAGDTLFPGGPGRTDLEGGDFDTVMTSIESRLFSLPADTLVMPGHGADTTIGAEAPHFEEWLARGW